MISELRYTLRRLQKTPGFTALTLFVMTAGLGLACFLYVLIRQLAYADLGFPDQDRIVAIDAVISGFEQNGGNVALHDFREYEKTQRSFEFLSPTMARNYTLNGGEFPQRVYGVAVRPNFFALAQVPAFKGRVLQDSDSVGGGAPVAVIGYDLWKNYFAGRDDLIGRSVKMDGQPITIVGVMPEGYAMPDVGEMWLPLNESGAAKPGERLLLIYGKLKNGVSIADANADLQQTAQRLEKDFPQTNKEHGIKVWPMAQISMSNSMFIIYMMLGAGVVILLLVWVNIGNLLLARASETYKESAIRAALGASRRQLLQQLLLEPMLLSVIAAILGCFFAGWALTYARFMLEQTAGSGRMMFWWDLGLTPQGILFTIALALITGVITGLLPAWRATSGDVASTLRDGTRGAQSRRGGRIARALVIAEIALSACLLIASLVLVSGVQNAVNRDYGARIDGYTVASFELGGPSYAEVAQRQLFIDKLTQTLRSESAVTQSAIATSMPGGWATSINIQADGYDYPDQRFPTANAVYISNDYFATFAIALKEGRTFEHSDNASNLPVAIVSSAFAATYWPQGNAIGKRVRIFAGGERAMWATVVGVSQQVLHGQPIGDAADKPTVYLPMAQHDVDSGVIAVMGNTDEMQLATAIRRAVRQVDSDMSVFRVNTLRTRVQGSTSGMRFVSTIFVWIAVMGLSLAITGIYGVTSRTVVQRTQEFGVRRALGASDADIQWMLAKIGFKQLLIGLGVGSSLGVLAAQLISNLFPELGVLMVTIAISVTVLIAAVVMIATYIPAHRAIRITPMDALRYE